MNSITNGIAYPEFALKTVAGAAVTSAINWYCGPLSWPALGMAAVGGQFLTHYGKTIVDQCLQSMKKCRTNHDHLDRVARNCDEMTLTSSHENQITKHELMDLVARNCDENTKILLTSLEENQIVAVGLNFIFNGGSPNMQEWEESAREKGNQAYENGPSLRERWPNKEDYIQRYLKSSNPVSKLTKSIELMCHGEIRVATSADRMLDLWNRYRVIELRPPSSNILTIGCGNSTNPSVVMCQANHQKSDTLDISFETDPTVIANWTTGNTGNYFKSISHRYDFVLDEGPIICFFLNESDGDEHLRRYDDTLQDTLVPNGTLVIPKHVLELSITAKSSKIKSYVANFVPTPEIGIKSDAGGRDAYAERYFPLLYSVPSRPCTR